MLVVEVAGARAPELHMCRWSLRFTQLEYYFAVLYL